MNESKVTTIDDVVETPAKKPRAARIQTEGDGDKVMLVIHPSNDFDGRDPVPIGHNERVCQIPRGTPCAVPKPVAQVIADAITDRIESVGGKLVVTQAPRYAYTITPA